jgi:hypothetical protein
VLNRRIGIDIGMIPDNNIIGNIGSFSNRYPIPVMCFKLALLECISILFFLEKINKVMGLIISKIQL